jgi:glutaconyl-CoA/methylmalonyl-CoA decarboxylase subunit gamma
MKITVKADNQTYTVEVGDIHDRPVIAVIEGEVFEVWPEEAGISRPSTHSHAAPMAGSDTAQAVRAPIPGVIISVAVKAGDTVQHGQALCVLDAMKMKNVIRAGRAGTIGVVHVAAQQHVKHHDVLLEYTE